MASTVLKRTLSSYSSSPPPSDHQSQTLITTAVNLIQHHRAKSRWTHLRSLFPGGFTPSQVSEITLRLRNNPHLALRFFLFTQTHSLCHHSLLSFSTIIHTLSRSRQYSHALTLIQSALRSSEPPITDSFSPHPPKIFETLVKTYRLCDSAPFVFDLLIRACLNSKRIDQCVQIVRMLRSRGIYPNVSTCNLIIGSVSNYRGSYAGYGIYREAFGLGFGVEDDRVGRVRVLPNVSTFNVILLAFYRDGLIESVEEIWREMERLNCVPNVESYCIFLAANCDEGRMEEAMRLWEEMGVKGLKHDVVAYNTMIGGFCGIGDVGRAEEFFREMGLSGIESTCVTFEHLIKGYCEIGDVDSVMAVYKDMCRNGFRPEGSTVDAVIGGLCDKSRVYEGLEFLRVAMSSHGIAPRGKSYECLIKGLCEEGKMEEALKLQAEMVGKGFKPNSEIYGSFIDGYMKQGNHELAGVLRKEMLETQLQLEDN